MPGEDTSARVAILDAVRVLGIGAVIVLAHSMEYIKLVVAPSPYWQPIVAVVALGPVTWVAGYTARLSYERILSKRRSAPAAARTYLLRRLIRIYPLYLLLVAIFVWLFYSEESALWITVQVLGLGVLTNKLLPPVLLTLYYVQLLFVFYLALVSIMTFTTTRARVFMTASALAVFSAVAIGLGDMRVVVYYPCFILGVFVPLRFVTRVRLPATLGALVVLVASCSSSILLPLGGYYSVLWLTPAAFSAVFLVAALGALLARFVRDSVLARLSYASFGAYLVHRPIYEGLTTAFHLTRVWHAFALVASTAIISFGLGYLLQWLYDLVVRLFQRKRHSTTGPAPV